MKKAIHLILALSLLLAMPACSSAGKDSRSPLEELPEDYSLEQAKADGCVVHEDGNISAGQEIWDKFVKDTKSGKAASVRLGFYYTWIRNIAHRSITSPRRTITRFCLSAI